MAARGVAWQGEARPGVAMHGTGVGGFPKQSKTAVCFFPMNDETKEPIMFEVKCHGCNKAIRVLNKSRGGWCWSCLLEGKFDTVMAKKFKVKKPITNRAAVEDEGETPTPSKKGKLAPYGVKAKLIKAGLEAGKDIDSIVKEVLELYPGEDREKVWSFAAVKQSQRKTEATKVSVPVSDIKEEPFEK